MNVLSWSLHQEMERVILATLRWDTAAVTPQDFLPHFLASMGERGDSEPELLSTLRRHSDTLAAMCVCDPRFLGTPPSLVAAASLNCALRGLGHRGPPQLAVMSETLAELCQTDPVSLPAKLNKILFDVKTSWFEYFTDSKLKEMLASVIKLMFLSVFFLLSGSAAVLQWDDRIRPQTATAGWASSGPHGEGRRGGKWKGRNTNWHERD